MHGFRGETARRGHREKVVSPKENRVLGLETQPMGKVPEHPCEEPGAAASVVYVYSPRVRGRDRTTRAGLPV